LGGIEELRICGETGKIDLKNAPDLILSGINAGANLGTDINYSGTASAARQGSFFGIPSIALSLVENDKDWQWGPVVSYITEEIDVIKNYWKTNSFININFPNSGKKPLSLVTVSPSMRYYNDYIVTFTPPEGGVYCFPKPGRASSVPEDGTDWVEVNKGNAALSVIHSQPVQMEIKGRE
jgi:5'-nucleotidase